MAYSKQTWDTTSYVNPTRMNHIENGIEANSNSIDDLTLVAAGMIEETEELKQNIADLISTNEKIVVNDTYGIDISYVQSGKVVTGCVWTNRLKVALPRNTWITLLSDLPKAKKNIQITGITISNVQTIKAGISIYIDGRSLQIIDRTGTSANDLFSINFSYIAE